MFQDLTPPSGKSPEAIFLRRFYYFVLKHLVKDIYGFKRVPNATGGTTWIPPLQPPGGGSSPSSGTLRGYVAAFDQFISATGGGGTIVYLAPNPDGTGNQIPILKPYYLNALFFAPISGPFSLANPRQIVLPDGTHTYVLTGNNQRMDTIVGSGNNVTEIIDPPYNIGDLVFYSQVPAPIYFSPTVPFAAVTGSKLFVDENRDGRRWVKKFTVCDPITLTQKTQYVDASTAF